MLESPEVLRRGGWLADLLPSVLVDDPSDDFGFRSLVDLFEDVWETLLAQIENIPYQFDPRTSSTEMTPWIASWVGSTPELTTLLMGTLDDTTHQHLLGPTAWRLAAMSHRRGTTEWYRELLGFLVARDGERPRDPEAITVQEARLDDGDPTSGVAIRVQMPIRRDGPSEGSPGEDVDREAVRRLLRRELPVGFPVMIRFGDGQEEVLT